MAKVWLFGKLSLGEDASITKFQTRKTASLFAYLALNPNREHSREALIEFLWPGEDPSQTKDRLNQALSWIRRTLSVTISSDRYSVNLNGAELETDVAEFETLVKRARTERDHQVRRNLLIEAMELSEEALLVDLDDDWVFRERDRLLSLKLIALQELLGLLESAGNLDEALKWAQTLVEMDELDEENHFTLIRLQVLANDKRAAQRQYDRLAQILSKELRLSPSLLFQEIEQASASKNIHRQTIEQYAIVPFAVPAPQNNFYGRSAELKRVAELLSGGTNRLITVTGIGGAGKTRLILEAAHRFRDENSGPHWFVSLAEIEDSRDIGNAILKVVGRDRHPDRPALNQILEELTKWRTPTLILDNFEHIAEGAQIVADLLSNHATLRVIATSRQKLQLQAEVEIELKPLPTPNDQGDEADSVLLFADRAQLKHRAQPLSPQEKTELFEICHRLEGIPLAIEIAAAWSNTFTLSEILDRLGERFEFLVNRRRDIVDRHRSLRAAIEYSFKLLPENLRSLFAMLSVFRGGWTLEGASQVAANSEVLGALSALQERSLVFSWQTGSTTRYGMYDTLREFAADQLNRNDRAELEGRHAEYYCQLHDRLQHSEDTISLAERLDLMDSESANTHAALEWCHKHNQASLGVLIARNMSRLWKSRGPIEAGRRWLSTFLEFPLAPGERANGLQALGNLAWIQSDFDLAQMAHLEAKDLFSEIGDSAGVATSKFHLAIVAVRKGELELAETLLTEILDEEGLERALVARAYLNLGNIAMNSGRRTEAKSFFERCLVIERSRNDPERIAHVYNNLGFLAFVYGQYTLSTFYLEESIRYGELSGNPNASDVAYANLARIATRRGQFQRAAKFMGAAFTEFVKFGNKIFLRLAIVEYALLLGKLGDLSRAAQCLAISDTLSEELKIPFGATEMPVYIEARICFEDTLSDSEQSEIREFVAMQSPEERLEWIRRLASELAETL